MNFWIKFLIACAVWCLSLLLTLIMLSGSVGADEIQKTKFVDAIIGEAEGEPYRGKLAVACAIRNRGTTDGICSIGNCSDHKVSNRLAEHLYPSWVFVDAVRAYEESAHADACGFIGGAQYWEGTAFRRPYWTKKMTVTATIGRQRFYRE